MGLGKTVQVICLFLEAHNNKMGPNLVVCPATLLENWRREIVRFAPDLKVLVHSGAHRTGFPEELRDYDVIISSFDTAVADVSLFRNIKWNIIAADEAQGIKNPESKRSIQLKTLSKRCAVAISGTPVENRLRDLWSITDFVLPSLLGSQSDFEKRFPDTQEAAAVLGRTIAPLMLRRLVRDVAADLPKRINIPQPLELDDASVAAYEEIRKDGAGREGGQLAALTKLRMFCAHPWIAGYFKGKAEAIQFSVKLKRLLEILEEIADNGEKAIVFTSFTENIDLLAAEITTKMGIAADFIDGRVPVPQRQNKVDAFASIKSFGVLLLNPRAAGTGLNITAANHVIHYSPEWNPAVEDQASARAIRRGQTLPVTVHRLYYVNTVEEIINERLDRKRGLAGAAVVGTDGVAIEAEDMLKALRISPVVH